MKRVLTDRPHATGQHIEVLDVHRGAHWISLSDPGVLYCDIDGTIADLRHRRIHVESKPKNWKLFEDSMHLDSPVQPIVDAVNAMAQSGWIVVMMTGRGAQSREVTLDWLDRHEVSFHRIYMRAAKDYRKDSIVKYELFQSAVADGFAPDVVLDDRDQVVEMWRENGVACIQVAKGDF